MYAPSGFAGMSTNMNSHSFPGSRGLSYAVSVEHGYEHPKGTHLGKQNGPTWGQMYTARGQSVGQRDLTLLLFLARGLATVCSAGRNESRLCGDATCQG